MSRADPARVFAALGDRTRLSLLIRLGSDGNRSIASLAADTHMTRQGVTKHLHVLEAAGLVAAEKTGRESRYSCRQEVLEEARHYLDRIGRQWDDALGRLANLVEGD